MEDNKDKRYKCLREAGIDVDELIDTLFGKTDIMEFVLKTFLDDENFNKAVNAINEKDYDSAFLYAHALKGVLANLAMTEMQDFCSTLVEKLRNKEYQDIDSLVSNMKEKYEIICNAIKL